MPDDRIIHEPKGLRFLEVYVPTRHDPNIGTVEKVLQMLVCCPATNHEQRWVDVPTFTISELQENCMKEEYDKGECPKCSRSGMYPSKVAFPNNPWAKDDEIACPVCGYWE